MKRILMFAMLFCYGSIFAQWVNFEDETATRIEISNISDNDNANAIDDQEKDFGVGDFDNDSFMDLVVVRKIPFSTAGPKTDLLLMNRNGVLVDETDVFAPEFLTNPTDARDVVVVDVNMDDWMDLFIVSTFGDQPKMYINKGEDSNGNWLGFEDESTQRLPEITLDLIQFCAGWGGDLTGNGAPDLYMVNYDGSNTSKDVLFINDGTGIFTDETEVRMGDLRNSSFGTGTEIHDVDNDGDLDIVKNMGTSAVPPFNELGTSAIFNNGDGTFTNFQNFPGDATYMFTAGDLNNDGMLDFYEVDDFDDYVNSITAIVVDESLTLDQQIINSDKTDVWGGNVKMVDIDNDGDLDVTIASVDTDVPPCNTEDNNGGAGGARTFVLFENAGLFSGDITDPYANDPKPWDISNYDQDFIDINNDGNMDMILGTCEGYIIFVNDAEPLLGLEDQTIFDSFAVYPNPTKGHATIQLSNLEDSDEISIAIYDLQGRMLTQQKEAVSGTQVATFPIDITNKQGGVYFVKVTTAKGVVTKKILVE